MVQTKALIQDGETLVSARYKSSQTEIPTYDDGFGKLFVSRNSIGLNGIVRAQTWEDAYGICEDEFFPEASETIEEIVKEYGFKREHKRILDSNGQFVEWQTIETPDSDAWSENELFQEAFGFRPNGPNAHDTLNHGIYAKDLNGDSLDVLTPELADALGIELVIESDRENTEQIVLHDIQGITCKSGTDEHGNEWIQFEVDYLAEQEDGECSICGATLSSGWQCLDGGEEVCDSHVDWAE